jgi:hypothetical protein
MDSLDLREEAEDCRRRALSYLGQPEATFLIRVARELDKLAEQSASSSWGRGEHGAGTRAPR